MNVLRPQSAALRHTHPTPFKWDLGLSVLELHAQPGRTFSDREIARACDVSPQAVRQLCNKALIRVRAKLETLRT